MAFGRSGLLFLLLAMGTRPVQLRGAELVGLVREAGTGEIIIGASVRAIPVSKNLREVLGKTNSSGRYQLELLKGKYRLFLSFPGSDYLPRFFSTNERAQGEIIDVPTFDSFRIIDLTMISGGSIAGKVVRFSDNNPLSNIRVTASSQQYRTSVTTRSDGSYIFRALLPGNYRVQAMPLNENFIPVYYGDARDAENSTMIGVERKQTQINIDFRLRNGGMISGRVYANKNREPVAAAFHHVGRAIRRRHRRLHHLRIRLHVLEIAYPLHTPVPQHLEILFAQVFYPISLVVCYHGRD